MKRRLPVRRRARLAQHNAPLGLLFRGLLSPPAFLRALGEPFVAAALGDADESLADFASRRFGAGVLDLVDAAQTGLFAGDPRRLSVSADAVAYRMTARHPNLERTTYADMIAHPNTTITSCPGEYCGVWVFVNGGRAMSAKGQ